MDSPQISIIVPLYNEEKIFTALAERLNGLLNSSQFRIQVVLVNDGSQDNTPYLMQLLSEKDKRYKSVLLSRNHGHQIAVSAGMSYADGSEAIMIIDGDLQDPPEMLNEFYDRLKEGYDVVYAIRKTRREGFMRRLAYQSYYRLQKMVSNYNIPIDAGDFCMISKRVRDIIVGMPEHSRYLRGMRSWVGFRQLGINYDRQERFAGKPKYTFKKLLELAFNGIFNFTRFPITLMYILGSLAIVISIAYIIYLLYLKLKHASLPQGYTTLIFSISFFSGVQLISLGLIGEYVYRTFNEVRRRPLFVVDKIIN